jgi:hypothetical protein
VAAGHEVGARRSYQAAELILLEGREDHVVIRARRAVEGEERQSFAELHVERRPEPFDQGEPVRTELRSRPFAHVELPLGRYLGACFGVEHERVGVAEHGRTAECTHERGDLCRLTAALQHVAETDSLIGRIAIEVGEHGLECDRVTVDVRDQRGVDCARLCGRCASSGSWASAASTPAGACRARP